MEFIIGLVWFVGVLGVMDARLPWPRGPEAARS